MATVWILNLDAEFEMAQPKGYQCSALQRKGAALGMQQARRLLGPKDVIASLDEVARGHHAGSTGRAWCPTPSVRAACAAGGVALESSPSFEVIRSVNDRAFCASLGQNLEDAQFFEPGPNSIDEVREHLARSTCNWLLKRAYSVAGKGQRRIRYEELQSADIDWLRASFALGGVQVEPHLQLSGEYSLHGRLEPDGTLEQGRPCVMEFEERGRFVATRLAHEEDLASEEQAALVHALQVTGAALHERGYFGPFGIDGFRWLDDSGRAHFRALSEINARYTLGWAVGMREGLATEF